MSKKTKLLFGITLVVFGLSVFSYTTIHALYYAPIAEVPVSLPATASDTPTVSSSTSAGIPVRLVISSIGVDATVDQVGISFKGNMSVPDNFTDVGWYKYGTVPGDIGSAVIDGHVDDGMGLAAVFKHIKEIPIGGDIFLYTENKNGVMNTSPLHFVVTNIETYYYTNAPLAKIFNQQDTARLNLITCDGDWVSSAQTDDHRVVVYSKLVEK